MEFSDVVRSRRMVRRYDPDRDVSRETVRALLDLATRAPSAGFTQGWQFLVLDDRADVNRYWDVTAEPGPADPWLTGMRTAPVVVLALADPDRYVERYSRPDKTRTQPADTDPRHSWPVPYWDVDTGMAVLLTLLAAVDHGLGGCLAGVPGHRWEAVRAAFDIPARLRFVGVLTLGHPAPGADAGRGRSRRPAADVVSWSRYTGP